MTGLVTVKTIIFQKQSQQSEIIAQPVWHITQKNKTLLFKRVSPLSTEPTSRGRWPPILSLFMLEVSSSKLSFSSPMSPSVAQVGFVDFSLPKCFEFFLVDTKTLLVLCILKKFILGIFFCFLVIPFGHCHFLSVRK